MDCLTSVINLFKGGGGLMVLYVLSLTCVFSSTLVYWYISTGLDFNLQSNNIEISTVIAREMPVFSPPPLYSLPPPFISHDVKSGNIKDFYFI